MDTSQTICFRQNKRIVAHDTLLTYTDFNDPFKIHTDASAFQVGAIIGQKDKPIAFYSRNIRPSPYQDVHFFYTRAHFSALQNCALILSSNFQFIFKFK